jgi:hypothetical protein
MTQYLEMTAAGSEGDNEGEEREAGAEGVERKRKIRWDA